MDQVLGSAANTNVAVIVYSACCLCYIECSGNTRCTTGVVGQYSVNGKDPAAADTKTCFENRDFTANRDNHPGFQ